MSRYIKDKFADDKKQKDGQNIDFFTKTSVVQQKAIKALIWDTSNQEKILQTITPGYFIFLFTLYLFKY